MKKRVRDWLGVDANESARIEWVARALAQIPPGSVLLDAGAGEQRFRRHCAHLEYVAQDFAQYDGVGDAAGLQTGAWNYGKVDIVCDVANIPRPDRSFDAILCTEVLEHVLDPVRVIHEFARLLRPGGTLILTAPFASIVHFAPYFFSTGFSRYWYTEHLERCGLNVVELVANGGWFDLLRQEALRLPGMTRRYGVRVPWFGALFAAPLVLYLVMIGGRRSTQSQDLASFGFHCRAVRRVD